MSTSSCYYAQHLLAYGSVTVRSFTPLGKVVTVCPCRADKVLITEQIRSDRVPNADPALKFIPGPRLNSNERGNIRHEVEPGGVLKSDHWWIKAMKYSLIDSVSSQDDTRS